MGVLGSLKSSTVLGEFVLLASEMQGSRSVETVTTGSSGDQQRMKSRRRTASREPRCKRRSAGLALTNHKELRTNLRSSSHLLKSDLTLARAHDQF